jgi:hypothetical protein
MSTMYIVKEMSMFSQFLSRLPVRDADFNVVVTMVSVALWNKIEKMLTKAPQRMFLLTPRNEVTILTASSEETYTLERQCIFLENQETLLSQQNASTKTFGFLKYSLLDFCFCFFFCFLRRATVADNTQATSPITECHLRHGCAPEL